MKPWQIAQFIYQDLRYKLGKWLGEEDLDSQVKRATASKAGDILVQEAQSGRNSIAINERVSCFVYPIAIQPDSLKFKINDINQCKRDEEGEPKPLSTHYDYRICFANGQQREGRAQMDDEISLRLTAEEKTNGCSFENATIAYSFEGGGEIEKKLGFDASVFAGVQPNKPLLLMVHSSDVNYFQNKGGWFSANNLDAEAHWHYGKGNVIDLSNACHDELMQFAALAREHLPANTPLHLAFDVHGSAKSVVTNLIINDDIRLTASQLHVFGEALPGGIENQKLLLMNCRTHLPDFTGEQGFGMVIALAPHSNQRNYGSNEVGGGLFRLAGDVALAGMAANHSAKQIERDLQHDPAVISALGTNLMKGRPARNPKVLMNNPNVCLNQAMACGEREVALDLPAEGTKPSPAPPSSSRIRQR